MTGVEFPVPRANGTADRFRRVGVRIVLPAGGRAVRGPVSPLIGSGVPQAALLIIRSRSGAARPVAGAIHSRLVFSLSGEGFSLPYETSYRAVKPSRVSAALGRFFLRGEADLPQVDPMPVGLTIHRYSPDNLPGVIPEIDIWRIATLILKC